MKSDEKPILAFEPVAQGTYMVMTQQIESYVLLTQADTDGFSDEVKAQFSQFDWQKNMAVGVAAQTNTGGYSMHIREIQKLDDAVVVHWEVESPPKGSISTMVISQPFEIVSIPRKFESSKFVFERVKSPEQ